MHGSLEQHKSVRLQSMNKHLGEIPVMYVTHDQQCSWVTACEVRLPSSSEDNCLSSHLVIKSPELE